MHIKFTILLSVLFIIPAGILAQDFQSYYDNTNFEKYKMKNEKLTKTKEGNDRVVFMGNSITEGWPIHSPSFISKNPNYIWRGISGQTTPQMLLRFRKDVIELKPKVVVILAGINDIAGNTGFTPIELIADNIKTMAEMAEAHGIKVVLCSTLPAFDFPWSPGLEPANKVIELNSILKEYSKLKGSPYVDYHSAMKDDVNGLKVPEYTSANDLVHPNSEGYKIMEKLIQPIINATLTKNK